MNFDDIMKNITNGLSGDLQKDIVYLQQKCTEYKDHTYKTEIMRECSKLLYSLLPDEKKQALTKMMQNNSQSTRATINTILSLQAQGDLETAFEMSETLVKQCEGAPVFKAAAVSEYRIFDSMFEQALYTHYTRPQQKIKRPSFPYAEAFYIHGCLLFEMKRIAECREYLKTALQWNPASCTIAFKYIETFNTAEELDTFFELSSNQFKYAYQPKDVAKCFRNLGHFYVETERYSVGGACYFMSMFFDKDNKDAQYQLYFLEQMPPEVYQKPTPELLTQYESEYGLPRSADKYVINLAYTYSQNTLKNGDLKSSVYFLEIYCGLTEDEKAITLLKELKVKISE